MQDGEVGRPGQSGGAVHHRTCDIAAALGQVGHRLGDEQVAVGVERGAQQVDLDLLLRRQRHREEVGRKHREPVADPSAGVFGAHQHAGVPGRRRRFPQPGLSEPGNGDARGSLDGLAG